MFEKPLFIGFQSATEYRRLGNENNGILLKKYIQRITIVIDDQIIEIISYFDYF